MGRLQKPASLKKGKSETKEQLEKREALERQLMGSNDNVKNIPEHLSEEEAIYYEWLVNEIEISELITNLDIPLLEQTATCLNSIRECDDFIRSEGLFVETVDKYGNCEWKENVAVKTKQNFMSKYGQLCNQLGLSPSARAALASKKIQAKQEEEDPVIKALKGEL